MTYPVTVTVTYPERVSSSGETGEVHSAYNFFIITKRSTRLPVNTYQNTITMGVRRHIAKILDKPYEYNKTLAILTVVLTVVVLRILAYD